MLSFIQPLLVVLGAVLSNPEVDSVQGAALLSTLSCVQLVAVMRTAASGSENGTSCPVSHVFRAGMWAAASGPET